MKKVRREEKQTKKKSFASRFWCEKSFSYRWEALSEGEEQQENNQSARIFFNYVPRRAIDARVQSDNCSRQYLTSSQIGARVKWKVREKDKQWSAA